MIEWKIFNHLLDSKKGPWRIKRDWRKDGIKKGNKVTKTIIFQKKEEPWNQIETRRERKGERAEFISAVIVSVR